MKFLLLAVAALSQLQRRAQRTVQTRGRTQRRARPTFGRFGGHTDVARRDNLYQRNQHVGRYGGYTRQYQAGQNGAQGRFAGRRDPFRADPNDARRGYNPYRDTRTQRTQQRNNGGADRMGTVCNQITAQTYQRECGTYTGRMGCRTTCQRLRQTTGRGRYTRQTRGRTAGRRQFGRRTTTRRTGGLRGRTAGRRTRRTGRNFGRRTQLGQFGRTRGRTTQRRTAGRRTRTRGQIRIPTQGGVFGRRTRGTRRTRTRQTRGRGRNGIFGNRLGQAGQNRARRTTRHQV